MRALHLVRTFAGKPGARFRFGMTRRLGLFAWLCWVVVALVACGGGQGAAPAGDGERGTAASQPGGLLDPSFGSGGVVTTGFSDLKRGTLSAGAHDVAIQADGRIVVVGGAHGEDEDGHDFAIARYAPEGTLDTDFDVDGKATTDLGSSSDIGHAVALQRDGKIVVAGQSYGEFTGNDFALVRYNPGGSIDRTFGTEGTVVTDFEDGMDVAYDVAVQPDGKIVAVGYAGSLKRNTFAVARYSADGTLDATFNGHGRVTTGFPGNSWASALGIDHDGRLVVAGVSSAGLALARYNSDASLDPTFSSDGVVGLDVDREDDYRPSHAAVVALALAVGPDGGIVVAGGVRSESAAAEFAIVRYRPDGSADTDFGIDGRVTSQFSVHDSDAHSSVVVQPDGKIVVAGGMAVGPNFGLAIARYDANGVPDTTFASSGAASPGRRSDHDEVRGLALQVDGSIVVVGVSGQDFFIARYSGGPVEGTGTD